MAKMDIKGSWVLVTGAASGIGLACAHAFAEQGAKLVLLDISEPALEAARVAVSASGAECIALPCDVSSEEQVAAFAVKVLAHTGTIDVLINNAGIGFLGDFMHTPVAIWNRIIGINLMGAVYMTQAFLPNMRADGGAKAIVNVASALGFTSSPALTAYAATKHAVVGMSEALGMELAGTPITVSIIAPGIINTSIVKSPGAVAETISDAQLAQVQRHYREKGCDPAVVARDVVAAVRAGRKIVPSGPAARLMVLLPRISRALMRQMATAGARQIGYWVK